MGVHIVDLLLKHKIIVVVAARSESKAKDSVERRSKFKDLLRIVVTGDLTAVGAFDDLVEDVDVIIHCASVSVVAIRVVISSDLPRGSFGRIFGLASASGLWAPQGRTPNGYPL